MIAVGEINKIFDAQKSVFTIDADDKLSFKFDDLSSSKKFDIFDNLLSILNHYSIHYDSNSSDVEEYKKDEYNINSVKFNEMLKRLKLSIELIKSDTDVEKSFDMMQESFKETNIEDFDGWRLFQIIFIILNIKDIVKKENFDITELLHVDTGGGKSEAYFGLVLFTAFHDRLTGKKYGVSAITKFPLRMLSIQQLQRISKIFIWAEEIRLNNKLGGDPFSIGYFVGNSEEFPIKMKNYI